MLYNIKREEVDKELFQLSQSSYDNSSVRFEVNFSNWIYTLGKATMKWLLILYKQPVRAQSPPFRLALTFLLSEID